MLWLSLKYILTAAVVVMVSEVARANDRLGALLAAVPLVSTLALVWMKLEGRSPEKLASHAWYTFWYVIPTLPMFLLFPFLLRRFGFWWTLLDCLLLTIVCFRLFAWLLKPFGIRLL